jgi:hypothetical protein
MILKLRDDYKKAVGVDFTLAKFQDERLSRGDPPIPLVPPFILGDDDGQLLYVTLRQAQDDMVGGGLASNVGSLAGSSRWRTPLS